MLMILFIICAFIVCCYWMLFFNASSRFKNQETQQLFVNKGVSVIVCYKNESNTIESTIKAILDQDYHLFEVVAVNDFSTDHGPELLMLINDPRLKLLNCTEDQPGKKSALTQAIASSQYDTLLFTDGDCTPASEHWIKNMVSYQQDNGCVLGFGPLKVNKGMLGRWQKYETTITAMQYMSYAIHGQAYMGVGRNLLISKTSFYQVDGYNGHAHIAAGDDDLLVQSLQVIDVPAKVCLHKDAWVYSDSKSDFNSYLLQKLRHTGVANYYQLKFKFLLGLFALAQSMFWFTALIILILTSHEWKIVLLVIILKWICQSIMHYRWFIKLDNRSGLIIFPILDVLTPVYYGIIALKSRTQTAWK